MKTVSHMNRVFTIPFLTLVLFGILLGQASAQYQTLDQAQQQQLHELQQREKDRVLGYVGKTYWYVPNQNAINRVVFLSGVPESIISDKKHLQFFPTSNTSFLVTAVTSTPLKYSSYEVSYLQIKFPDDKIGFIEETQLEIHLYIDHAYDFDEYIYSKSPETLVARQGSGGTRAEHKVPPKLGMTKQQVLASSWGKSKQINKATDAPSSREQWVYSNGYLYFEKDLVVAVDK